MKKLISLFCLVGCGTAAQETQTVAEKSKVLPSVQAPVVQTKKEVAQSFVVTNLTELESKKCAELNEGQIAYIASDKIVMACTSGAWLALDLKGETGSVGATGTQGVQGVAGANGLNGAAGVNGTNGLNGTNGIDGLVGATGAQGVQGIQGVAGANGASQMATLYSETGSALGKVSFYDSASGHYSIFTTSGMRLRIANGYTAYDYAQIYFASSNCTGSGKLEKKPQQFENVFLWDNQTATHIHKKRASTYSTFNALSKRLPHSGCINIASTSVNAWDSIALTAAEQAEITNHHQAGYVYIAE
jgi:hypothetical protein